MNFSTMSTEFINVQKYSYYSAELHNFEIAICDGAVGSLDLVTLQGIRTENIISSIEYLVDHRVYFTKSIALKYITAIAQFFRYSSQQHWFSNADFLSAINSPPEDKESYYYKLTQYIKKNPSLASPVIKEPLSYDEVVDLINYIDDYFSSSDTIQIQVGKCSALWIVNSKSDRFYKVRDLLNSSGDKYPSVPCKRMLLNQ